MDAKVILKTGATAIEFARFNRCYLLAESGEEIKVTKEMVRLACTQLLSRCKK
ncbi:MULTISPECIES: PA1571 family protein [Acinetobacter]|uniref:Uncharacterized protein n=1 Tax=Acinetobacter puyangensis TaxID=1096779 RepID=A0A240E987_9GAMM|nr:MULTISPECIES: PA1571 family protein [Acinetobacter]MCH4246873.1 hypothetical protein [Acinetobacter populi]SNX44779.1 hypothetical protein SAMN05421731_104137 [Acinetobacter puyangensis]